MATTVDTLLVRIEADLSGLRRDLQKVQRSTAGASQKIQKDMSGISRSTEGLSRAFKGLVISAGAFFGAGALVRTIRTFEDLQATLKAVTGSSKLAAQSFKLITRFTAQTTFQLEEVTGAFITLVNAGIAPTEDALRDIGNLAAARGKDIRQVAQAIFNATTGEMEMLKQLGIIARVEGEQLAVTYKGVTETIDRSGASIVEFIRNLSQQEFPNAIEERANTLSGSISNLQDNISLFFMEVGDAGLRQALTDLVKFLIDGAAGAKSFAQVLGQSLAMAVRAVNRILEILAENFKNITIALSVFLAVNFVTRLAAMTAGLYTLAKALVTVKVAQIALNKAMLKNPFILATSATLILASELGALDDILKKLEEQFDDVFSLSDEGSAEIADLNAEIAKLGTSTKATGKVLETDFTKTMANLKEQTKMAKAEVAGLSPELINALQAAGGLSNIQGNTLVMPKDEKEKGQLGVGLTGAQVTALEAQVKAQKAATKAQDAHRQSVQLARDAVESLKTEEDRLNESLVAVSAQMHNASFSADQLKEAKKRLEEQIKALDPMFQALRSAVQTMSTQISESFADMLMSGQFNMSALQDIFKNFVRTMIAKAIELMIINRIMNAAFGLTGANALPTANIPFLAGGGKIPARASGGPVLVGERGPELFIPNSAGVIRNNHDTMNMMSGGQQPVVNQTINVTTGVAQTVRAEVMSMMPRIKSETINAMIDGKKRGNAVAKAFG